MLAVTQILPDGGPFYAETDAHAFIAEPYNALSSLAYLIPAIYWFIKLKGKYNSFLFLSLSLPLLIAGGLGSTFYHAFRTSFYLLMLDVLPIAILTLMVSIYFWTKILNKKWQVFVIVALFLCSRFLIFRFISSGDGLGGIDLDRQTSVNISYFISGTMIFLPALLFIIKNKFLYFNSMAVSCTLFILGLLFREVDTWGIVALPMGTHWLWHISTACGCWFLGDFLYRLRRDELSLNYSPQLNSLVNS